MRQVLKEWLGDELANGMSRLQEKNGRHHAEKGSEDARAAPSSPDNTDVLAGVQGATYGRRCSAAAYARKCPLLQVRGSRLGLLSFASSYLVRSRARMSPA